MEEAGRWCLWTLCLLGACNTQEPGNALVLRLQTDLDAGVEFDQVAIYLHEADQGLSLREDLLVEPGVYFPAPQTIAELNSLPSGDYLVEVLLQNQKLGQPVYRRPALVSLSTNLVATVPIDRSCLNVRCPPEDDPNTIEDESTRIACVGGQCVDARCTVETPEFCGDEVVCAEDTDCGGGAFCASASCNSGLCWYRSLSEGAESSCEAGSFCHPTDGCLPIEVSGASCGDGLRNGDEEGIDCGGACAPCVEISTVSLDQCLNGNQDSDEEAIDCGGPCTPCEVAGIEGAASCESQSDIPVHECRALHAMYSSLGGDTWTERWNLNDAPCSWFGVSCSNGKVSAIELPANELSGELPEELVNLRSLATLNLRTNSIAGNLPENIGLLTQLRELRLTYNKLLGGTLPASIGGWTRLQSIAMAQTGITGPLPPEIGQLKSLRFFNAYESALDGTLPPELGGLENLREFSATFSAFEGTIPPTFAALPNLRGVDLAHNRLEGEVPEEFLISSPSWLDLWSNYCLWATNCDVADLANASNRFKGGIGADCNPPPEACP